MNNETLLELTAEVVSAHVGNNKVTGEELAALIEGVHQALAGLGQTVEEATADKVPVVSIRASVKPDYIVCMECGKKQKTLKRHLQTAHGMTPDQYRRDYGLPASYPMVAENYSARRSDLARENGLGRKRGSNTDQLVSEPAAAAD